MDYSNTAARLIDELGGKNNIASVTHCMTRLRFVLKNDSVPDDEKVKKIKGVMGVMKKGGQYQVIIGNEVQACYKEVVKIGGFHDEMPKHNANDKKEPLTWKGVLNNVLDVIAGSMAPLLPVIIGCGMVKLLNIILGLIGVPETNMTFQFLAVLGDVGFYFLPILLAYTASKKFGCNAALAMTMTAVLLHPDLTVLFDSSERVTLFGLPVTAASYASSVIPALLITWIQSYVEKFVDKITPGWTKTVFKPMIILIIMLPLALVVLAPLGTIIGDGVQFALAWLQTKASWLTLMIFSALMPFIVMSGMHYAFIPACLADLSNNGFETLLIPAMLASNLAQGAAATAVLLRTKNRELKSVSGAASASALIAGITEPALYGVNLRLKKPLAAACIGSGAAGLFIGIVRLKSYSFATPALMSIIQFISPDGNTNFIFAIIAAVISIAVTFVTTLALGWEDIADENEDDFVIEKNDEIIIDSPIKGDVIPLNHINDETFASGILGKGLAIIPTEGKVFAPFDGKCEQLFDTLHALGLKSKKGVELLIHVGLETVGLNGKPFKAHIKQGDTFKKGDLLLEFDIDEILKSGCEISTPVIVTNGDSLEEIKIQDNHIIIGG